MNKNLALFGILMLLVSPALMLNQGIPFKKGYISTFQAQSTLVSGYISEDTTWTLEGSPYVVVGDVIVESDVFLTVEAGVVAKFTNGTNLVIDGGLIAQGNSTHKITFTSNATTPAPGDWGNVLFRGLKFTVDYVYIEYATTGIKLESSANISNSEISRCTLGLEGESYVSFTIHNVTVIDNLGIGVYPRSENAHVRFESVKISNNGGTGIYAVGSFVLQDSEISNNSNWGIYLFTGTANVENSVISGNIGYGLYGLFNITNSIISHNNGTAIRGSGSITRSTISHNYGHGIEAFGGEAHYNNIYNNTGYAIRNWNPNFNATHNWWGTTNETLIEDHIHDYYDDYNLGKVFYKPYLTSPVPRTIRVPRDYLMIQEAMNAANPRDTIFVSNGIYYENVVVNKSVSLIGEHQSNTTIDGGGVGNVVEITADNVIITGFTIRNSGGNFAVFKFGIALSHVADCYVGENNITNNYCGIWLTYSSSNTIVGNNITDNNYYGIGVLKSSGNTLSGNLMNGNKYALYVKGYVKGDLMHSIDVSNLVNGKPVYYLVNQTDLVINSVTHPQVGYLALINSTNITIEGLTLTGNGEGLLFVNTSNSRIANNNITNNYEGFCFIGSLNNTIVSNNMTANNLGIYLYSSSSNNRFYHNNFVDNTNQAHIESGCSNTWDDGYPSGGNYWDDYKGSDSFWGPGQNETGSDGIGDISRPIFHWADLEDKDNYPLMSPYEYWSDPIPGDINKNMKVDHKDLLTLAAAYGSTPEDPNWNPNADLNNDSEVDHKDLLILASNYGKET